MDFYLTTSASTFSCFQINWRSGISSHDGFTAILSLLHSGKFSDSPSLRYSYTHPSKAAVKSLRVPLLVLLAELRRAIFSRTLTWLFLFVRI